AAEPRSRVDAHDLADYSLRLADVRPQPLVEEQRQPGVVEAVVADEMAVRRDPPGQRRRRLDPPSLEEPGRGDVALGEDVEEALGHARTMRSVGVLRAERQRDAKPRGPPRFVRHGPYFSTPLITIPRVKKRWKTRKIAIGITIVISVPAWIRPGLTAIRAP